MAAPAGTLLPSEATVPTATPAPNPASALATAARAAPRLRTPAMAAPEPPTTEETGASLWRKGDAAATAVPPSSAARAKPAPADERGQAGKRFSPLGAPAALAV